MSNHPVVVTLAVLAIAQAIPLIVVVALSFFPWAKKTPSDFFCDLWELITKG
jgi:hypothetical protein